MNYKKLKEEKVVMEAQENRTIIRFNPEFHITRFDFTLGKTQIILEDELIKEDGIQLIAKERNEQINKHHRSLEYDKGLNTKRELISGVIALIGEEDNCNPLEFPEQWDTKLVLHMSEKEYKERLIIAGALIAAEIDRIS